MCVYSREATKQEVATLQVHVGHQFKSDRKRVREIPYLAIASSRICSHVIQPVASSLQLAGHVDQLL